MARHLKPGERITRTQSACRAMSMRPLQQLDLERTLGGQLPGVLVDECLPAAQDQHCIHPREGLNADPLEDLLS